MDTARTQEIGTTSDEDQEGCADRAVAGAWRFRSGGTTFSEGGARQESDRRLRHTHAEARVVLATALCAVGRKRMVWKSFGVLWMIDVSMGITHDSSVREVSHEDVELEDVSDSS